MLALGGVYVDELELDIQLTQRPEDADRKMFKRIEQAKAESESSGNEWQ